LDLDLNRDKIVSCGGIAVTLDAMKLHSQHASIQENACATFVNLSVSNDENQALIGEQVGIDSILNAMKLHKKKCRCSGERLCSTLKFGMQ